MFFIFITCNSFYKEDCKVESSTRGTKLPTKIDYGSEFANRSKMCLVLKAVKSIKYFGR
jgi:hypothetical protein